MKLTTGKRKQSNKKKKHLIDRELLFVSDFNPVSSKIMNDDVRFVFGSHDEQAIETKEEEKNDRRGVVWMRLTKNGQHHRFTNVESRMTEMRTKKNMVTQDIGRLV
jgi:hypothetical protein